MKSLEVPNLGKTFSKKSLFQVPSRKEYTQTRQKFSPSQFHEPFTQISFLCLKSPSRKKALPYPPRNPLKTNNLGARPLQQ
ncbi:hypothetical protein TNIN_224631 [Trichonephila inaurata madagascariensis]|uniref:Uncharacterized protein n=1 Tax=Trichonephila inaurata madagascariensis TaxID=2747483 RepID=A0A8X6YGG4_9ARAC|nr:hypothetical protein TNIN_224631 [Trichonephila inaurata madagascariensis]